MPLLSCRRGGGLIAVERLLYTALSPWANRTVAPITLGARSAVFEKPICKQKRQAYEGGNLLRTPYSLERAVSPLARQAESGPSCCFYDSFSALRSIRFLNLIE
jgi:hypothetical protein